MARVEDSRDLISVGAYRPGADAELDRALRQMPRIESFLRQAIDEPAATGTTLSQLVSLTEVE
jgi:flagellum-specific ATP synthase